MHSVIYKMDSWRCFSAALSYLFYRRGISGDGFCKLTKFMATCIGDKNIKTKNVSHCVAEMSLDDFQSVVAAVSSVDEAMSVYNEKCSFIKWLPGNETRLKLYAIDFFFDSVKRPCNRRIKKYLIGLNKCHAEVRLAIKRLNTRHVQSLTWKWLVPKTNRLSLSGVLKEISHHLSKTKTTNLNPLVKMTMERFSPSWPFNLMLVVPRSAVFVSTLCNLQRQVTQFDTKTLRRTLKRLSQRDLEELKTVMVTCARSQQTVVSFDDPRPRKKIESRSASYILESTSVCLCQCCASVLTYVDLKNRPPIKGVYHDDESLQYRCGSCHSEKIFQFPLVDPVDVTFYRVSQPDLPTVGVCRGGESCFNLTAYPRSTCGSCAKRSKQISVRVVSEKGRRLQLRNGD